MGNYKGGLVYKNSRYVMYKGARGAGRLHAIAELQGHDNLILQALRLKLRYPLGCLDIDKYIERVMLDRDYGSLYYFTDLFDPKAVIIRRSNG